jgi:hypothetical protein
VLLDEGELFNSPSQNPPRSAASGLHRTVVLEPRFLPISVQARRLRRRPGCLEQHDPVRTGRRRLSLPRDPRSFSAVSAPRRRTRQSVAVTGSFSGVRTRVSHPEALALVLPAGLLIDLWYVTQTTRAFSIDDLEAVKTTLAEPDNGVDLAPFDLQVFDAWERIERSMLPDPWDRMIVATAMAMGLPPVTRDPAITGARLVTTV